MYKCDCGYTSIRQEYCIKCQRSLQCDCSNVVRGRIKDILIPYENGYTWVTIRYTICDTCGKIIKMTTEG